MAKDQQLEIELAPCPIVAAGTTPPPTTTLYHDGRIVAFQASLASRSSFLLTLDT